MLLFKLSHCDGCCICLTSSLCVNMVTPVQRYNREGVKTSVSWCGTMSLSVSLLVTILVQHVTSTALHCAQSNETTLTPVCVSSSQVSSDNVVTLTNVSDNIEHCGQVCHHVYPLTVMVGIQVSSNIMRCMCLDFILDTR